MMEVGYSINFVDSIHTSALPLELGNTTCMRDCVLRVLMVGKIPVIFEKERITGTSATPIIFGHYQSGGSRQKHKACWDAQLHTIPPRIARSLY